MQSEMTGLSVEKCVASVYPRVDIEISSRIEFLREGVVILQGQFLGTKSETYSFGGCWPCNHVHCKEGYGAVKPCILSETGSRKSAADESNCGPCPPGTYKGNAGSEVCSPCDPGMYNSRFAATVCTKRCPSHSHSLAGSKYASDCLCNAGYTGHIVSDASLISTVETHFVAIALENATNGTVNGTTTMRGIDYPNVSYVESWAPGPTNFSGACRACMPGRYKEVNGSSSCVECAAGKYSNTTAATNASTCRDCPSYSHSTSGSDNVTDCLCNPGYSGANGGPCHACAMGAYKPGNGTAACFLCDPGKYVDFVGALSCLPCPIGLVSAPGSDSVSDCVVCNPGKYIPKPGMPYCLDCERGKYSSAYAATGCERCPPNSHSPPGAPLPSHCLCNTGYTGIILSDTRLYAALYPTRLNATLNASNSTNANIVESWLTSINFSNVQSWAPGPTNFSGSCRACIAGTYKITNGTAACTPCEAGKYSPTFGANASSTCITCPAHSQSEEGSSNITHCLCNAGYSGRDGGVCSACVAGKYKSVNGSAACTSCDAGKYSEHTGAASADACTNCAPGKYSAAEGNAAETDCDLCAAGKYSNASGATASATCQLCGAGKFSAVMGASNESACQDCPAHAHSIQGASNGTRCLCNAGYSGADGGPCIACAPGQYKGNEGSALCTDCPPGTYSNHSVWFDNHTMGFVAGIGVTSSASCIPCPLGSESAAGSWSVENCTSYIETSSPFNTTNCNTTGNMNTSCFIENMSPFCPHGFTGPNCAPCVRDVYTGKCEVPCSAEVNCSKHGRCRGPTGICECFPGWSGDDCSVQMRRHQHLRYHGPTARAHPSGKAAAKFDTFAERLRR